MKKTQREAIQIQLNILVSNYNIRTLKCLKMHLRDSWEHFLETGEVDDFVEINLIYRKNLYKEMSSNHLYGYNIFDYERLNKFFD